MPIDGLNLNNLTVDDKGRVSFSGIGSGIDWQETVDKIIEARRVPVDTLETRVTENEDKIAALKELRTSLTALQSSLSKLYGAVTFQNANNIFEAKTSFASVSRIDGGTPSTNLVGVSVTNASSIGSHTIEVLRTAKAHKIASDAQTSTNSTLGFSAGDQFTLTTDRTRTSFVSNTQASSSVALGTSGSLTLTDDDGNTLGTVAYAATDTLDDLAAAINAGASGVTATIETLENGVRLKLTSATAFRMTETGGGSALEDFEIGVRKITVNAGTTLADLRDLINAANSGENASGVIASIVTASPSEAYLFLTAADTGVTIAANDVTGTALQRVGLVSAGGAIKNQVQAPITAQFYADGLLDQTNTIYESALQAAATDQVGSAGTLSFTLDADGSAIGTVNYAATDTLADIAANITANVTGVTAEVVTDGVGVRLEISGTAAFSFTDGGSAVSDLEIDNKRRVIERTSNTVSDVFAGVTLSLYQAEQGTTVQIDIERDLTKVKTEITNFVTAYNDLRTIINGHRLFDPASGTKSAEAGVLFDSPALEQVATQLSAILGVGTEGVNAAYRALGSIGINFAPYSSDPLTAETLEIDEAKLDEVLLNHIDDVRKFFSFSFTSSDSRVSLLGFNGKTTYNETGYTLNLQPTSGANLSAYSEQLDNAAWTPVRSSVSADGATAPDGTMTADGLVADATNNTHYLTNASGYSLTAGETYIFSTYVKAGNKDDIRLAVGGSALNNDAARIEADLGTGTITSITSASTSTTGVEDATIEDAGNGWYRVSMKVTATQSSTAFLELYAKDAGTASFAGDGSTVNAWFWGTQVTAAEHQTTVLSDADLTGTRATISANAIVAPDGSTTADGLVGDTANNSHLVSNSTAVNVTAGEQYDYVAYVQAGARSQVRLALSGGNFAADTNADFDLASGTVSGTGAGVDSATITDVGGGWYKVVVSATATSSGTAQMDLYARDAATGLAYVGDDAAVDTYFWGQKLVQHEAPPSYAPTTSTAGNVAASANIDGDPSGADDGSVTLTGNTITVNSGGAEGLKLFYSGFTLPESVQIDFTVGIGAQFYYAISDLLERSGSAEDGTLRRGAVEAELDQLADQNEVHNDRITEMLARLDIQRNSLLERFLKMEQALYTGNRIIDSIKQATQAMFGGDS